jgi:hypothetical protein
MKKIETAFTVMLVLVMFSTAGSVAKQGSRVVSGPLGLRAVSSPVVLPKKNRRTVKVFFYHEPGEYIDLSPVIRQVSAIAPARAAIEALLKGPTAAERQRGFGSLASATEFRISSLTIGGGTARINFVSNRSWPGWPGDLAPARFKKAGELTLQQFPAVRKVIVSLNGDEHFDSEK